MLNQTQFYLENAHLIENLQSNYGHQNIQNLYHNHNFNQLDKQDFVSPWNFSSTKQSKLLSNKNLKTVAYDKFLFTTKNLKFNTVMRRPQTIQLINKKQQRQSDNKYISKIHSTKFQQNKQYEQKSIFISTVNNFKQKYKNIHNIKLDLLQSITKVKNKHNQFQKTFFSPQMKYKKLKQKLKRKLMKNIDLERSKKIIQNQYNLNKYMQNNRDKRKNDSYVSYKQKKFSMFQNKQKESKSDEQNESSMTIKTNIYSKLYSHKSKQEQLNSQNIIFKKKFLLRRNRNSHPSV